MSIQNVLVTGSDGHIGQVTVEELQNNGYNVTPADKFPKREWRTQIVDFEDLGQVIGVMRGHDAVVHLAAIPTPTRHTAEVVFRNNVMSTFNVLEAATILGIKHVVLASSLSALGYAYYHRHFNPVQIPIDETHPLLSQDTYGLSKMVGEELAIGFALRTPDLCVTSLRFTWVLGEKYRKVVTEIRKQTEKFEPFGAFWTYVDVRDAARACRLSMEYTIAGHEAFYISAPNIYMDQSIRDLLQTCYPGDYPIADHIVDNISPVDCSKAEKLLGWQAQYNWDGNEL